MLVSYNSYDYDDILDCKSWSKEKFMEEMEGEIKDDISEEELQVGIEEAESGINDWIDESFPENVDKYSDYIEPIKISFKSNSIVYPLKISQISTRVPEDFKESLKSNEVLLYVLSDNQVKAPEFNLEFNKEINRESLENFEYDYDLVYSNNDLESLKGVVEDKDYYLTKMRRDFAKDEMDEDLYLIEGEIRDSGKFDVLLFKGESCPHCADAEDFLDDIKYNFEDINLKEYEIYNNSENKKLYDNIIEKFNINSAGVPLIVIGDDYVLGFGNEDISGKKIIEKINNQIIKPLAGSYQENTLYLDAKNKIFGSALSDRLKGRIVLKVEDDGKAYYINPTTKYSHYLGRPADAFSVMREQGIGITTDDLDNIPMALNSLTGDDADGDGLPDKFEDAIGTNVNNPDTDGDGFSDKQELEGDYDPNKVGGDKLNINDSFAEKQKGRILLQVENNGEAWYINPEDGKRYFLGRPADAFQVMRNLGLGISNEDFGKL
ncbi:hypothetical protein K8R62_01350 [bacterium]|nr:hypothetical protein [bacterium]